jgi:hypothetical protein
MVMREELESLDPNNHYHEYHYPENIVDLEGCATVLEILA